MRVAIVFVLAASLTFAAPLPKVPKPRFELSLSVGQTHDLRLTIHNHQRADVTLSYQSLPVEMFDLDLRDQLGRSVPFGGNPVPETAAGRLTIPAGKTAVVELHLCHTYFPEDRPAGRLFAAVHLRYEQQVFSSNPVAFGP